MIKILEESKNNLLAVRINGKIDQQDFEVLNPVLEKTVEENSDPRAYFELLELEKVTPKALWEDLKNIRHYNKFERVAMVGDSRWKEWMANTVDKMVKPSLKFFNYDEKAEAMNWVKG